jgi:hypothetical protein
MAMRNAFTRSNAVGYPGEGKGQKRVARKREEARFSKRNIKARL